MIISPGEERVQGGTAEFSVDLGAFYAATQTARNLTPPYRQTGGDRATIDDAHAPVYEIARSSSGRLYERRGELSCPRGQNAMA